tara:strand:- start:550 stop:777 length:228 start_codon:yes stop_codon:yes gene_type:complete
MEKKRFFWDSSLADWIEIKMDNFVYWFTNKKYPSSWEAPYKIEPAPQPEVSPHTVVEEKPAKKKRVYKKKTAQAE